MSTSTEENLDGLLAGLAASAKPETEADATPAAAPLAAQAGCDVLIADDAGPSREILSAILRTFATGLRIREARNGEEGVKMYMQLRPHVTMLDIDMPVLDGISAMKRIREIDAKAFIAIVSGSSSADNVRQALQGGANAFVVKPFMPQRIIDVLNRYEKLSGRSLIKPG